MKMKSLIVICVGISFIFFCVIPLAEAGRGCTGVNVDPENFIEVDKKAPGTKYKATLTIYYAEGVSCAASTIPANMRDMYFFMRMEGNVIKGFHDAGGSELMSFAGLAECIPYWNDYTYTGEEAIVQQQQAIDKFFRLIVNPYIYSWNHPEDPDGCDPATEDPGQMCPPYALKSIGKIVDGDVLNEFDMTILDLVIAIVD